MSATNPKTLFFYAAFFPQFVDPASPPGPQLALLSATFLVLATVLDGAYAHPRRPAAPVAARPAPRAAAQPR